MITTLILFLACVNDKPRQEDIRPDWVLYTPPLHLKSPINREITWSAPEGVRVALQRAADDWNVHLSCGLRLKRVETGGDVTFVCGKPDFNPFESEVLGMGDNGKQVIASSYCKMLPHAAAVHAWGHSLGFDDNFETFQSVLSPHHSYTYEERPKKPVWGNIETDGFRIWAKRNGAPGCGNKELPWSWQKYPDFYLEHPTAKEANKLLEE
jgi:hypothetical protein